MKLKGHVYKRQSIRQTSDITAFFFMKGTSDGQPDRGMSEPRFEPTTPEHYCRGERRLATLTTPEITISLSVSTDAWKLCSRFDLKKKKINRETETASRTQTSITTKQTPLNGKISHSKTNTANTSAHPRAHRGLSQSNTRCCRRQSS